MPSSSVIDHAPLLAIALAQATDPISDGAGWIGAGLLGAVLSWLLLKHLPDKDRQMREMMTIHDTIQTNKDAQIQTIVTGNQAALRDLWEKESLAIKELTASSQKSIETVAATFTKNIDTLIASNQTAVDAVTAHCQKELDRVFDIVVKRNLEMREYRAANAAHHDDPTTQRSV